MNELYHFGILGQKWGVRRYQNPDGSLTAEGRKHYDYGLGKRGNKKVGKIIQKNIWKEYDGTAMVRDPKTNEIIGVNKKALRKGVNWAIRDARDPNKIRKRFDARKKTYNKIYNVVKKYSSEEDSKNKAINIIYEATGNNKKYINDLLDDRSVKNGKRISKNISMDKKIS